jgi:hypothetical protein
VKPVALVLLLALPAQAQDAGTVLDVERATVTTPTGSTVEVGSGCYLDERACVAAGKRAAGDDAEKQALKDAVPSIPTVGIVLIAGLVCGLAVGAAVATWAARR